MKITNPQIHSLYFFYYLGSFVHFILAISVLITVLIERPTNKWLWFSLFTFLILFDSVWLFQYLRIDKKQWKSNVKDLKLYRIFFWCLLISSMIFYFFMLLPIMINVKDIQRFNEYLLIYFLTNLPTISLWLYMFVVL